MHINLISLQKFAFEISYRKLWWFLGSIWTDDHGFAEDVKFPLYLI